MAESSESFTPQRYYDEVLKPRERGFIAREMGAIARQTGAQSGAVQTQNLDLSRRLGLSAGFAQAQTEALDAKLRQDQAQAIEGRRASLMQEVSQRRAQSIDELLQRQQSRINSAAQTVGGITGAVGSSSTAVGGALLATPITAPFGALAIGAGAATSAIGAAASQGIAGEAGGKIGTGASRLLKNANINIPQALGQATSQGLNTAGQQGRRRFNFLDDDLDGGF